MLLVLGFIAVCGFLGCSSGGGAAATEETATTAVVSSITDLPDVATLVATSSSSSLSALSKDAVTGTPPLLIDISSSMRIVVLPVVVKLSRIVT